MVVVAGKMVAAGMSPEKMTGWPEKSPEEGYERLRLSFDQKMLALGFKSELDESLESSQDLKNDISNKTYIDMEESSNGNSFFIVNVRINKIEPRDNLQRRLAQNREAARKSRLKKKAYVQELESGRLKLAKLEYEIERTRQQVKEFVVYDAKVVAKTLSLSLLIRSFDGAYVDLTNTIHGLLPGNFGPGTITQVQSLLDNLTSFPTACVGIATFETKYDLWVVEQQKKESELMSILQTDVSDVELRVFVDGVVDHYQDLFLMKADAAKADAFNLLYGSWRSPVERLFQWLGGFRPSEVLYILMPWFEPITDTQVVNISKLRHTCRQAEDALTQGIDKLEQTLAQGVGFNMTEGGSYDIQMKSAMEGLDALENFLNQADHLRYRTLQQMSRILTVRQAARGLVALGEYFQRLRVLNSLWLARPHSIGS
ncbi:hypothetical protein OSB04_003651 [Centaurea solstitialis]|uniref:DOG1 domain-containing protein n=1 Tax=Centaurea solstitialis TaxID=347529 RepID=A0AA38U6Z4_9ASTR|nr:hypothetical protein OSB04_003651 [Centaurea solstitialis]